MRETGRRQLSEKNDLVRATEMLENIPAGSKFHLEAGFPWLKCREGVRMKTQGWGGRDIVPHPFSRTRKPHARFQSREAIWLIHPSRPCSLKNIMYSGTSGVLAYIVCRILFGLIGLGWVRTTVVERQSVDDFNAAVKKNGWKLNFFCNVIDYLISSAGFAMLAGAHASIHAHIVFIMARRACRIFQTHQSIRACLPPASLTDKICLASGVPSRQLELGLHRSDNFQTVFKRICSTDLVHDNYFYYGYIAGEYSQLCCPRYREEPTLFTIPSHSLHICYEFTLSIPDGSHQHFHRLLLKVGFCRSLDAERMDVLCCISAANSLVMTMFVLFAATSQEGELQRPPQVS